jgi:hypothetical protein
MSRHAPGSRDWWIETALIALAGVVFALWLWPDASTDTRSERPEDRASQTPQPPEREDTLADFLDRGCLTAEDLQAMREGRSFQPSCPPELVILRDLPPSERPFP